MKEIRVSEHIPDQWILSTRRVDPPGPDLVVAVSAFLEEDILREKMGLPTLICYPTEVSSPTVPVDLGRLNKLRQIWEPVLAQK